MVSLPLNFNGVLCRGQCKWSEKRKLPSQSSILLLVTHTHTTMSSISIRTSSTYVRFGPNALSLSILWSRYNKSIGGIRLTVVVIFFVSLVTGKPLLLRCTKVQQNDYPYILSKQSALYMLCWLRILLYNAGILNYMCLSFTLYSWAFRYSSLFPLNTSVYHFVNIPNSFQFTCGCFYPF